jgi:hypothetical protein
MNATTTKKYCGHCHVDGLYGRDETTCGFCRRDMLIRLSETTTFVERVRVAEDAARLGKLAECEEAMDTLDQSAKLWKGE